MDRKYITKSRELKSLLTIQFIPGWTDFYLENGVRLDIMTSVRGLEQYSFDEAYNIASVADIENCEVPFYILTI